MKLTVKNLTCSYEGQKIVENIDMQIAEGEFVSILGPSGCGKSSILSMIAGTLEGDQADILVDGKPVKKLSEHFAYMPQQDLLLPWRTVMDNVCLYGQVRGRKKEALEKAAMYFEEFGLGGYETRYPHELSGGMRQRAAFLRTALCAADIMLLDEPFGGLDVITRNEMQDWLRQMRTKLGKTTILVTHDIEEAIYLSDRIFILKGRPARFIKELRLSDPCRSREWLLRQTTLKKEIYGLLI